MLLGLTVIVVTHVGDVQILGSSWARFITEEMRRNFKVTLSLPLAFVMHSRQ